MLRRQTLIALVPVGDCAAVAYSARVNLLSGVGRLCSFGPGPHRHALKARLKVGEPEMTAGCRKERYLLWNPRDFRAQSIVEASIKDVATCALVLVLELILVVNQILLDHVTLFRSGV